MAQLIIKNVVYFSESDEDAFFEWLNSIPGVVSVNGTPEGLVVSLRSKRLSRLALYELLAIHTRYRLPVKSLAQFITPQNKAWFSDPKKYWHNALFGK